MTRIVLVPLMASLLAGCVTASTVDQVRAGMSPDQVQAILGDPETVAHAPGSQCSYYTVLKDFWSRTPWTMSNRYVVCYDEGRVKSFGRADTPTSG
ncbi:MAG: outer membrane protein assembly factor BamE [Rhodospirillales bacterium]|nr:outer membrane protein assembly factor BamE [Rhodospirillales bacterium]